MHTQVRTAVEDDQRTLVRIARAAWSWESSVMPRESLDSSFFNDLTLPENVLVAVRTGQVLGFIKLVPMSLSHPKMAAAVEHVQQIYGFSVAPEHQRSGAGSALLRAVRHEAAARGARRITLRVLSTNDRAEALYRAHGYQVEGVLRREFLLQGKFVDDVLMALDLGGQIRTRGGAGSEGAPTEG